MLRAISFFFAGLAICFATSLAEVAKVSFLESKVPRGSTYSVSRRLFSQCAIKQKKPKLGEHITPQDPEREN